MSGAMTEVQYFMNHELSGLNSLSFEGSSENKEQQATGLAQTQKYRNLRYQVYDLFITIPKMYTFISIVLNRQLVVSGILEIIVFNVVLQKTYQSLRITLTKTANASQFFDPATDFGMILNRILIIHSFCDSNFILRHS